MLILMMLEICLINLEVEVMWGSCIRFCWSKLSGWKKAMGEEYGGLDKCVFRDHDRTLHVHPHSLCIVE